jgi:hypothetical protein
MKHITALLATLLILSSCNQGLIPRGKLSKIISDIYLSDKYISSNQDMITIADSAMLYEPILNSYGYTSEDFLRTIAYYVERPAKLKTVYLKAQESLQEELDIVNIQLTKEGRADSLMMSIIRELSIDNKNKIEPDSRIRSLRWIIFPQIEEIPVWITPDTSAINFDAPVSRFWWNRSLRQHTKPFNLYENDRRTILVPRKLELHKERVRDIG